MNNIEEIKTILFNNKDSLKEKYNINEIGIFGSYIKGSQSKKSDIDILVDFQKTTDLLTFVNLKNHLVDLLNADVDLVMKKALKPKIGKRILSEIVYI